MLLLNTLLLSVTRLPSGSGFWESHTLRSGNRPANVVLSPRAAPAVLALDLATGFKHNARRSTWTLTLRHDPAIDDRAGLRQNRAPGTTITPTAIDCSRIVHLPQGFKVALNFCDEM